MAHAEVDSPHNLRLGETRSGAPAVVFDFAFDDDVNDAVKRLPGRLFDWERRIWGEPVDQPAARAGGPIPQKNPWPAESPDIAALPATDAGWAGAGHPVEVRRRALLSDATLNKV